MCWVMSARSFSVETSSLCCDETTTVSTRMGVSPSVLDADLSLAVRPEVGEDALAARLRQTFAQPVREHDRQRHQFRRLAAGVAEHQALVAGAAGVHAHGDVGRLAVDRRDDAAGIAVEPVLRVGVADLADGFANQLLDVDVGVGGDLAGDEAEASGDERFARHAAGRILGEDRVQDAVRDLIGDLVRMSFRHRLGREQVAAFTTHVSPSGRYRPSCGSVASCQIRSNLARSAGPVNLERRHTGPFLPFGRAGIRPSHGGVRPPSEGPQRRG